VISGSSRFASTRGDAPGTPSPDNFFSPVALCEQQGGQVGMVDPPPRSGSHKRFGVEGDAEPGAGEHRQIVGAIADRDRLLQRNAFFGGQPEQRLPLRFGGDDRWVYPAGQTPRGQVDPIGDNVIETEFRRQPFGEDHEPARDQRRRRARCLHGRDQLTRPGSQSDPLCRPFEHATFNSREQRDPRLECGCEVDLAVHRAPGNFGDLRANPNEIREFVDHLVLDDRRFQIGDQQAFAPCRQRLNDGIDRRAADDRAHGFLGGRWVDYVENKIAGLTRGEPDRCGRDPGSVGDRGGEAMQTRLVTGTGDQSKDNPHGPWSYPVNRRPHKRSLPPVIVIAGPTASGKSALALELADALSGTVINADSLQSYRDLRVLTARPDEAAERRAPHRLYGFLDASERGSAGRWRNRAVGEIDAATNAGRLPILVGGTGLYLRALAEGLAPIPEIPEEIRREAVALHRTLGDVAFRERLAKLDPVAAQRLFPGDKQRLVRAFEVARATGVPIAAWQQRVSSKVVYRFGTILLAPPRDRLYGACNARFVQMIEAGAVAEAAALAARRLDPDLPAMKAVGLPELLSHLRGEMPLGDAIAAAQRATRRYAKRQMTWFRHQTTPDLVFDAQFSESLLRCSRHFIDRFLLTVPA
jgi:tRNA dimethylallyltransferase